MALLFPAALLVALLPSSSLAAVNSWTVTGSMSAAWNGATATLLDGPACRSATPPAYCGRVLVAGGYDPSPPAYSVSSSEIYDPVSGTWSATGSMTAPRNGHTATLLDGPECHSTPASSAPSYCGKVLVAGGSSTGLLPNLSDNPSLPNAQAWTSTAELYDPARAVWTATGSMSLSRNHHTAVLINQPSGCLTGCCLAACGEVLVAGGDWNTGPADSGPGIGELYDPRKGTWHPTGALATDGVSLTSVQLPNGRVLLTGGADFEGGGCFSQTQLYDPATGAFIPSGNMNVPRDGNSLTALDTGRVLVTGGDCNASGVATTAELFDPTANNGLGAWSLTGSTANSRPLAYAVLLPSVSGAAGKVLVDGSGQNAELYDPATGLWSLTAAMVDVRDHGAVLLNSGKVLALGGGSGSNTAEIFSAFPPGRFIGDASTLYGEGVSIRAPGTASVTPPGSGGAGVCEASVNSVTASGTTRASGLPLCEVETGGTPAGSASVDTAEVTTSGDEANGTSRAETRIASLTLLPTLGLGGGPVLQATALEATSTATCVGGTRGAPTSSSRIARLTLWGQTVATQPMGSRMVFNPLGGRPGSLGYMSISGQPLTINPTGGRIPMAIVTLNPSRYDPATNTMTSSALSVDLPAGGPLSNLIVGRIFISLARSGLGCHP